MGKVDVHVGVGNLMDILCCYPRRNIFTNLWNVCWNMVMQWWCLSVLVSTDCSCFCMYYGCDIVSNDADVDVVFDVMYY